MRRRSLLIAATLVIAIGAAAYATRDRWMPLDAQAQAPAPARAQASGRAQGPGARTVPVDIATATRKDVPIRLEALGTVQPIASVAIKARVETTIVDVLFEDGALVNEGDLLFKLDSRQVEAQIRQTEGVLQAAKAQLEQAERDLQRYTELFEKKAGTQVSVNNAATQVNMLKASVTSGAANLDNLRVQLDHHTIRAAISGRISAANVKVGNFVRPADTAPLATIVQTKPVYVTFGLPQRALSEVRPAMRSGTGRVEAMVPGDGEPVVGKLAMVDNSVDPTTGMITIRARMDNDGETLWPGTLVNVVLVVRVEQAVTVPSVAVQVGQSGTFAFVVKDGTVTVRPVRVARTFGGESVIAEGLNAGEVVVTDGQLLLANGTKVAPRRGKAGA